MVSFSSLISNGLCNRDIFWKELTVTIWVLSKFFGITVFIKKCDRKTSNTRFGPLEESLLLVANKHVREFYVYKEELCINKTSPGEQRDWNYYENGKQSQTSNQYISPDWFDKTNHKSFATRDRNFSPGSQNKIPHVIGL